MMKNATRNVLGLLFFVSLFAIADVRMPLNNVSYQLSEQQWVKTDKATLIISVNATTTDQNITKVRQSILSNLQKIETGEWHITQFNRSQTSSGLDNIAAQAEIRISDDELSNIRTQAQVVSKTGQSYRIKAINFQPDLGDVEQSKNALREEIYKQVQNELKALNASDPKQQYFVHQINFLNAVPTPRPSAMVLLKRRVSGGNVQISQRVTMAANVTLSSIINAGTSSTSNTRQQ